VEGVGEQPSAQPDQQGEQDDDDGGEVEQEVVERHS